MMFARLDSKLWNSIQKARTTDNIPLFNLSIFFNALFFFFQPHHDAHATTHHPAAAHCPYHNAHAATHHPCSSNYAATFALLQCWWDYPPMCMAMATKVVRWQNQPHFPCFCHCSLPPKARQNIQYVGKTWITSYIHPSRKPSWKYNILFITWA